MTILALAITTSPRRSFDKLAAAWHRLLNDLFDPYRPERHYMRGPGPKWRAKHLPAGGRGR
jgi:hypothetical protein